MTGADGGAESRSGDESVPGVEPGPGAESVPRPGASPSDPGPGVPSPGHWPMRLRQWGQRLKAGRLGLYLLPLVAASLVLLGIGLLLEGGDGVFSSDRQACLFSIPAEEGLYVLDRNLQLHKFREARCEPGPILRTAEGLSVLGVPEFAEFIREWAGAVETYPELPGMLSEIQLSRTRDTVFYTRNGRLRIDVAHRQSRRWPHTLFAALRAAEVRGWAAGYMDLKDEDGLFIRER